MQDWKVDSRRRLFLCCRGPVLVRPGARLVCRVTERACGGARQRFGLTGVDVSLIFLPGPPLVGLAPAAGYHMVDFQSF